MSVGHAQPVVVTAPRLMVSFPASPRGAASESAAVPFGGGSQMVVVMSGAAGQDRLKLHFGNTTIPVEVIGHDPVSSLGIIRADGSVMSKALEWADDASNSSQAFLHVMEPDGAVKCRTTGWIKQVGGKILPFALLRVSFGKSVPPPGTPLLDDSGRVVAIFFQGAGTGTTGYAIPAEAVHRVKKDICNGGRLVRGWLGIALRAESQVPQISRVIPDSPAARAGIQPKDVLLSIGHRQISDYADAANAFFYLMPDKPVGVKVLRGVETLDFTLTPTQPKG